MQQMSANTLPEYSEEIPIGNIKPEQYYAIARQAVARLKWQLTSASGKTIQCYTARNNPSLGEAITIEINETQAGFRSVSGNEYYWVENQNKTNAELFKATVARIITKIREHDRKLNPIHRSKYGAIVPSKSYAVAPVLIYINVLIFLLMVLSGISFFNPDGRSLVQWGGNFSPLTANGEWWRLFTYMFLHGGIWHLLGNMYALLYVGMYLEPLLGKVRLIAAYVLTGLCAGLASLWMHPHSVAVGASGAIFGLYGVFLALLTTKHIEKTTRVNMLRSILFFVVFNLMMGLQGNTDNAAHVGGLLSGLAIGYAFYPGISKEHTTGKVIGITAVLSVIVALLVFVVLPLLGKS